MAGAHKFPEGYYFVVPFRRVSRLRRPFLASMAQGTRNKQKKKALNSRARIPKDQTTATRSTLRVKGDVWMPKENDTFNKIWKALDKDGWKQVKRITLSDLTELNPHLPLHKAKGRGSTPPRRR